MLYSSYNIYMLYISHWFWTCGLVSHFDWDCPELIFKPQTSCWRYMMVFCNFTEFTVYFWIKWDLVCENQRLGSGHIAWLIIWDQLAQNLFLGSRTQAEGFLILDNFIGFNLWFGKNEILFVKSKARVLDLWHGKCFGPKWPITSF